MWLKQSIGNWLGVGKQRDYSVELEESVKGFKEVVDKLEREIWKHRQILEKEVTSICPVCSKSLIVWPLGSRAYYQRDGEVYHVDCYDKRSK